MLDDENAKMTGLCIGTVVTGIVLIAMALFLPACQDDDCPEIDTKCNGHRVMMCAGGDWEELDNCATLYYIDGGTSDGVCCETPQGAECREGCE